MESKSNVTESNYTWNAICDLEKLIDNAHKSRTFDNVKYFSLEVFYIDELCQTAE